MYALWTGFMGYTEGYKAFQKKFSPMVVTRALTLRTATEDRPKVVPWALVVPTP